MEFLDSWLAFGASVLLLGWFFHLRGANHRKRHHIKLWFVAGNRKVKYVNLKVSQSLPLEVIAEDKFDNVTQALDEAPVFSLTDDSLGSLKVDESGLKAVFKPSGKLGELEVHVAGKADGKEVFGKLSLSLLPGDAVEIVLKAGEAFDSPEEEAAPAPSEE